MLAKNIVTFGLMPDSIRMRDRSLEHEVNSGTKAAEIDGSTITTSRQHSWRYPGMWLR